MDDRRIFPRTSKEWPVFFQSEKENLKIGHANNVSLSGINVTITNKKFKNYENYSFKLKFSNKFLEPGELIISGLTKWIKNSDQNIELGIEIDNLDKDTRTALIRYLGRSDKLNVEIYIIEKE